MNITERVARAIYHAAFANHHGGKLPEPGWCWDKSGPVQQVFASKQATAAIDAFLAAAAEQDWRLVPYALTLDMENAGNDARLKNQTTGYIYRATLDAAPKFEVGDG